MGDDKWTGMGWHGDLDEGKAHFEAKYGVAPERAKLLIAPDTWLIGPIPEEE